MSSKYSITPYFGENLAILLSEKIKSIYPEFDSTTYISTIEQGVEKKTYTERIIFHAEALSQSLPSDYEEAIKIILQILGDENPNETGMFKHYYWILPLGKYVELYGLDHFDISIAAISEITKRNTGEYAIRPFIRHYPERTVSQMKKWATSDNFHLRRLASEGLRPKLPWASKLDTYTEQCEPVFEILNILKEDPVKFVQKSVANHLTDYLKVNPKPTEAHIASWLLSSHPVTQWICKHATRKYVAQFSLKED